MIAARRVPKVMNITASPSLGTPEADTGVTLARSGSVTEERKNPRAGVSWKVLPAATLNCPEYLLNIVLYAAATVNITGLCGFVDTEPFPVLTVTETPLGAEMRTMPEISSQSRPPSANFKFASDCGSSSTRTLELRVNMAVERQPVATPELPKRAVPEAAGSPFTLTSPYAASSPTIFSDPGGFMLRAKADGTSVCKITTNARTSKV
jgi:hypothetical protein